MTQVLLLGDSLIADNDWQARMPSYTVTNLGVPGMVTAELLSYLPDIKRQAQYADVVLVMVGTNDMLMGNFEFINPLREIFIQLTKDFPAAEVLVSSLFPMKLNNMSDYTITNLNSHIEAFAVQTGCCYLDTHSRLSATDQNIFQKDGVHLTTAAYEIWTRNLLEHIAFLIEDD